MRQTIEKTWKLLNITIEKINVKTPEIILNEGAKDAYNNIFRSLYNEIKNDYMKENVKNLDRHKVAGIIIVSLLKANAIVFEGTLKEDEEFFGKYTIATSVGITFLQDRLNEILTNKGLSNVEKMLFPEPLSCDTPYFQVFCRNLYYADRNPAWNLNPLDIAEKLFLIEYMTLEKNEINPLLLKVGT